MYIIKVTQLNSKHNYHLNRGKKKKKAVVASPGKRRLYLYFKTAERKFQRRTASTAFVSLHLSLSLVEIKVQEEKKRCWKDHSPVTPGESS